MLALRFSFQKSHFLFGSKVVLQVVSHMMPDLPNVGLERDIEGFVVIPLEVITLKMN